MSPLFFLIAALIGLALGPLVFAALHRAPSWQLGIDGFVLVAVVGLVAFHVLPEAFETAGFWTLAAAAAGLFLPLVVERVRALSSDASHGIVLALACAALMLHASLDGVGLGTADGSTALAVAIVLHRLPVGLAVWWLVRPQFGRGWASAVLVALGLATIGGFAVESVLVDPAHSQSIMLIQAFVAGSLLHVLLHQSVGFHDHAAGDERWHVPGAVGALLALGIVGGLAGHDEEPFAAQILEIAVIASPLLLVLIGLGVGVVALKRGDEPRAERVLTTLDVVVPWTAAALVLGAMLAEDVAAAQTLVGWAAAVVVGLLFVVTLAHRGPRDFLLEILPLDELAHDHHHEHEEASTVP